MSLNDLPDPSSPLELPPPYLALTQNYSRIAPHVLDTTNIPSLSFAAFSLSRNYPGYVPHSMRIQ